MSLDRFRTCLPRVLRHEAGYVDHSRDPGGATNLGVTLATAHAYRLDMDGDGDVDKLDVKALTPDAVAPVYHRGYWLAASCDKLPCGLDYIVFDTAVLRGPGKAVLMLQRAAGVDADGLVGPKTITAANNFPGRVIESYAAAREAVHRASPNFDAFGRGWLHRLAEVKARALKDAQG